MGERALKEEKMGETWIPFRLLAEVEMADGRRWGLQIPWRRNSWWPEMEMVGRAVGLMEEGEWDTVGGGFVYSSVAK